MTAFPWSTTWLWFGELLETVGVVWIALAIYRNGRLFGAQRMRAIELAVATRTGVQAAWRRLEVTGVRVRSAWRHFRHIPQVYQLSAHETSTTTDSVLATVTYGDDTRVTLELRRRIEELEARLRTVDVVLSNHDRRLDDAKRTHRDLAAGGVYVQARSVVLVIAGSLITTASTWLSQIAWWWGLLILVLLGVAWILVGPTRREARA
jgi:hypothetical protein